ncbi:hypothetical protein C8Q76DRAFT_712054 [Earliella scabrosa]|nr:hypothetical protein C8Q76DRAFT_712054 [Earliella scabrosa]
MGRHHDACYPDEGRRHENPYPRRDEKKMASLPLAARLTLADIQTYGHCERRAHDLAIQCTEAQDHAVLTMAEDNGWKRCPVCGQIVKLVYGCNHMTCRCKHQFCFVCTRTWRTCSCPLWDERNLAVAANDMELLEQAIARVDEYNIEMDWPQRTPTPHPHFEEQPIARIHVYETADDWPQKPASRLRPAGPEELELPEERTEPRRWRPPTPHPEGADLPANASQAELVQEPRPLPILAPIPKRPPTGFSVAPVAGPSDVEPSAMSHGDRATAWRQTLSAHHQCAHNHWTRLHPGYTEGISRLCTNCATLRVDVWVCTQCATRVCTQCRFTALSQCSGSMSMRVAVYTA